MKKIDFSHGELQRRFDALVETASPARLVRLDQLLRRLEGHEKEVTDLEEMAHRFERLLESDDLEEEYQQFILKNPLVLGIRTKSYIGAEKAIGLLSKSHLLRSVFQISRMLISI